MVKHHRHLRGIALTGFIGAVTVSVFALIFGWSMTLRYLLGAVMFGTFTVGFMRWLNGRYGKKRIFKWLG